jgi:arylsulfatase A-like enzyme
MRRAVLLICDGHRADLVRPDLTPHICALAERGRRFARHTGVFPSVTRVSSASIATGCHPAHHGLHGNTMALDEGEGLVVRDVGHPDFRARMRRATGVTLRVPTLAQLLTTEGGQIVFSNVSPGAAYFQDPDCHGFVYHRDGCFGPGATALGKQLPVSHDAAGDLAMTERFCVEVLQQRRPRLAVLWLCEPDHTMHASVLGSPEHLAVMRAADACVGRVAETVAALNAAGDEILLLVGSDHGQETVSDTVRADALLVEAGLKASLDSTDVVVAPQGFSGLVYCAAGSGDLARRVTGFLERQDWVGSMFATNALDHVGMAADGGLVAAFTLRRSDARNGHGIAGESLMVAANADGRIKTGLGNHGGLGPWERSPFLVAAGAGVGPGTTSEAASSIVDIAPTILRHLGLPATGMDGRPLALA